MRRLLQAEVPARQVPQAPLLRHRLLFLLRGDHLLCIIRMCRSGDLLHAPGIVVHRLDVLRRSRGLQRNSGLVLLGSGRNVLRSAADLLHAGCHLLHGLCKLLRSG